MSADSTNPTGIKTSAGASRGIDYQNAWTLTRLLGPNLEPVTRAEAKLHCRVDSDITADDDLFDALIIAAREWVEDYTGRALIDQTWQLKFDGYSFGEFRLHRSPVIAIDSFIYDLDGVATTLAADQYELDGPRSKWPRLIPAYGISWPVSYWARPLTIQFRAGYANRAVSPTEGAEKVPEVYKQAIKLLVGHFYENREAQAPPEMVKWLLRSQRCDLDIA